MFSASKRFGQATAIALLSVALSAGMASADHGDQQDNGGNAPEVPMAAAVPGVIGAAYVFYRARFGRTGAKSDSQRDQ